MLWINHSKSGRNLTIKTSSTPLHQLTVEQDLRNLGLWYFDCLLKEIVIHSQTMKNVLHLIVRMLT